MSKEINNREYRQRVIKDLITQLHRGKSVDEVKGQFEEAFQGVSAGEIAAAEQALIAEGLPVEEVQRLCDVHAAVFEGAVAQVSQQEEAPGHPASVLHAENKAIKTFIEEQIAPHLSALVQEDTKSLRDTLKGDLQLLYRVDLHYKRKENLFFPYMEKYGITAPPKVMWGVDDEIRTRIKEAMALVGDENSSVPQIKEAVATTVQKIIEMITKEEEIMLPMVAESFTLEEWAVIANESGEIGYCLIDTPPPFHAARTEKSKSMPTGESNGLLLPTGGMNLEELIAIFNTLPVDITFVGSDDTVKYFSQSTERIFPRTTAIIGRKVSNCHPPASVHIVEGIVADFKSGKKDSESFWLHMGKKFVYIRYFALRGDHGQYLGTLEVTQDIAPIRGLEGEKRLVSP